MPPTLSAPAVAPAWDCWAIGDRFEYRDVRVDGDDGPIVDHFCARIPADGLTAIVGPSGSGKTTLLRLLNRLDDPDAGEVLLDGRDVRSYDVLDLRRRVQLVGQVPVPFPGSVVDNLAAVDGEIGGGVGDQFEDLLARVGLPPVIASRPADVLSVGEAQRMCLARALARHPDCLVLDEPTSALDTASKGGIERLIRSLADDGLTVDMVTHDPRQASELADRVIEVHPR
jgi:putative ABC transport system ATP-binding protein